MSQRYGVVIAPVSHIKPQSLEKVFKTCGTIESLSFIEDNGKKIQCQIFYTTPGAANKAVKEFDGQAFLGKVVTVIRYDEESKPEDIIINTDQPIKNKETTSKLQNKPNKPNERKNKNSITENEHSIQYQSNDLNEDKNSSTNNDQDQPEDTNKKRNENTRGICEDQIPMEYESSRFYKFENVKNPKDDSEKSRKKKSKYKSESSTTDSYSTNPSSSSDYSSESDSDSNAKKKKSHHHHSHKRHHHSKSHRPRHHHHHHRSRSSKH